MQAHTRRSLRHVLPLGAAVGESPEVIARDRSKRCAALAIAS
jgi:hypothetical protein